MASTTILSDNGASSGSAGLKTSGGNDGVLILQTTTSGGTATNAIYVDTSQNVGIGTATPAQKLHVEGAGVTQIRVTNTGNGTGYLGIDGSGNAYVDATSTSSALIFKTQATDRGRFDSNGNFMINTTSSAGYWTKSVTLTSSTVATADAGMDFIGYRTGDGDVGGVGFLNAASSNARIAGIFGERNNANNSGALTFHTMSAGTDAERARIDSSGNFLVGTTGVPNGTSIYGSAFVPVSFNRTRLAMASSSTASLEIAQFFNPNGQVGSISTSGSATAYTTSSDYRLKNTVEPMTGAMAKVSALKPCTYKWNADGADGEGFIAHELAEVCPHAVFGDKDGVDEDGNPVYQAIDTSFLVATLTAAIQEQQAIITSLTERISALEGAQA